MQLNTNKIKAIIWDWNGTLLNDVDICISCMNVLLKKRKFATIDKEKYVNIFTFPVRDYYQNAGFDFRKENFEVPAMEFIKLYHQSLPLAKLQPCANDVLAYFESLGLKQFVLSAMEHNSLLKSLKDNKVYEHFIHVNGIDNHYAHSKLEIGKDLIIKTGFTPDEILLIGDTLHDKDVAEGLGVNFVLVAKGHQSKEKLLKETSLVVDELLKVKELLS